jgi:hypothetical protein
MTGKMLRRASAEDGLERKENTYAEWKILREKDQRNRGRCQAQEELTLRVVEEFSAVL